MRGFRWFSFVALLSFFLGTPFKPTFGLSGRESPTATALSVQTVTLGNATAALTGPWKFHIGDSPQSNGAGTLLWAQASFDDSAWGTMDLTPPPGSYDPLIGSSGYVPGWTTHAYKGYSGYAWYRLRLNIQNGQTALALKMPDNFDDAYQIYVNGQWIGEFGHFTAHGVIAYTSLPRAFPLPTSLRSGFAIIAIRMWMGAFTPLVDQDAGGLHGPPVLGQATAIGSLLDLDWYAINRSLYGDFLEMAILLLALLVAFGLFWLDRREPAFLWLGLTCAVMVARAGLVVMGNYTAWINGNLIFLMEDAVLTPVTIGLWVVFWAYWFRLTSMSRMHRIVWGLVALLGICIAMLRAPLYGTLVPVHAIAWLSPLILFLKLLLGVVLVWVTVRGIRRDKVEGWLALPAVVLVIVSQYQEELLVLHVPVGFFPFGIAVNLTQIAIVLSLLIITVLMLRRFVRGQREREQWKLEIEQARQVQQVLIPQALPVVPGLTLESEYRPAQQVGGDFFQIIEQKDGSLVIVLGDVSGKGLKAAMLVSLIVGAIRMAVEALREPMPILEALNRRLCGRMEGHFATCMVARVAPNGETTIANAGHLPPYLNGNEVGIAGSLPLGIAEEAKFEQAHFALQPGDRLTLLTDGVLEAMNSNRELFGFARVDAAMRGQKSAAEIAAEAQAFGQLDDITVVRVTRSAAAVRQIADEPALVAG
jgi:Stage II sporulation protein E (SpoIIE)